MANFVKIQVFVPENASEKIRQVLASAGAGRLGKYDSCCYISKGIGYWQPLEGSNPAIGEIGRICTCTECKIEAICKLEDVKDIIKKIRLAHPYEEPAIDVIPLLDCAFEK